MENLLASGYATTAAGLIPLGVLLAIAVWHDLVARRIPNAVVFGGTLLAVALHALLPAGFGFASALPGGLGLGGALAGLAIGLVAFLPFYLLGGTGAGDVKLMGMVGAFLGPTGALGAVLATVIVGAVLALVVSARLGVLGRLLHNVRFIAYATVARLAAYGGARFDPRTDSAASVPYALAIALGTAAWLALERLGLD